MEDFKDGEGNVEFKGTRWSARCYTPVKKGDWVTIQSKDSLISLLNPLKSLKLKANSTKPIAPAFLDFQL